MSYLVLDPQGEIYYEAVDIEEAIVNCPPGYQIVNQDI